MKYPYGYGERDCKYCHAHITSHYRSFVDHEANCKEARRILTEETERKQVVIFA